MAGKRVEFLYWYGRAVVHLLDRSAGLSYCRAENVALSRAPERLRSNKRNLPVCLNCTALVERTTMETLADHNGERR